VHPSSHVRSRTPLGVIVAILLCVVAAVPALADTTFVRTVDGERREVTVSTRNLQQTTYVPLADVANALGGSMRALASTTHVSLGLSTAVIGTNQRRVDSSNARFDLQYPLIHENGQSFVAAADVPVLFSQAFAVQVSQEAARTPAPEPEQEPAPEPGPEEASPLLEPSPLEPLAPAEQAPAEQAPATAPETLEQLESLEPLQPRAPASEAAPEPEAETPPLLATTTPRIRGNVVVIDAGHGGSDPGFASGNSPPEKDVTLQVALEVRRILEETTNLRVHLTRTEDVDLSIRHRVDLANQQQGNLLVSIHTGASPSAEAQGFEVFFPLSAGGLTRVGGLPRTRGLLGEPIRDHALESSAAARAIAASVEARSRVELRGTSQVPLRMTANLNMPCVLVELGYLSNTQERARLATSAHQRELAEGIAAGIAAVMGAATGGA